MQGRAVGKDLPCKLDIPTRSCAALIVRRCLLRRLRILRKAVPQTTTCTNTSLEHPRFGRHRTPEPAPTAREQRLLDLRSPSACLASKHSNGSTNIRVLVAPNVILQQQSPISQPEARDSHFHCRLLHHHNSTAHPSKRQLAFCLSSIELC
jgi:hypothetical protein